MRRFSLTSLRVQAALWTLLPLTVIMLIVGSVGLYAYSQAVSRLVRDRDEELVRVHVERLNENMLDHASVLVAVAENEQMRSVPAGATATSDLDTERQRFASQNRFLKNTTERGLLQNFDGGVTLFNTAGDALISYATVPSVAEGQTQRGYQASVRTLPDRYAERPYFRAPQQPGEVHFTNIIHDPLTQDEPGIVVSVPVFDERGAWIGVLAGSFLLRNETLGDEIAKVGVGTAFLVDGAGRVIWHPDEALLGQDWSRHSAVQALLETAGQPTAQIREDEAGATVIVGTARAAATGWGLVIEESWASVIGPVQTFQWILFGTLGVGVALVMVILSSGTRRLSEPIRALVRQTRFLSQGNFVGHVEGGAINEMRALADAFNEMADRVARYRAGLQSYVAAITQSQEEERKRIARELHDDTIQSLIALGRRLELLEQHLENPIEAAKQLYHLQQMLATTVAEVRRFSRDLRPLLLEDVGLEAAVRQMLREMERRDGVETELAISGPLQADELDDELEVVLYRIAQEALNNIRKHADARHIAVALAFEPDAVRLEIRDDGRGFPLAETADLARRGSFGLMGIRERTRLFGGTFEIASAPGEGTRVTVCLPPTAAPESVLEALRQGPLVSAAA